MAAVYATAGDIIDAAVQILHATSADRTMLLGFLNEVQVEWQRVNPTYEACRTDGSFALTATTKDYAFTAVNSACIAVDIRSFHDGTDPIIFKQAKNIRKDDRAWTTVGRVIYFTVRPSSIRLWRVPDSGNVALYPTIYLDYFTRLEKLSAETSSLTQYPELDRAILVKGVEWRGMKEQDDPEWSKSKLLWDEAVMNAGSIGGSQATGQVGQISLGPYFDPDLSEEDEP